MKSPKKLSDKRIIELSESAQEASVTSLLLAIKSVSNKTGISILFFLLEEEEIRVNDLAIATGVTSPAISQQLKKMREAGLVSYRRDQQTFYYRLEHSSPFISAVKKAITPDQHMRLAA